MVLVGIEPCSRTPNLFHSLFLFDVMSVEFDLAFRLQERIAMNFRATLRLYLKEI